MNDAQNQSSTAFLLPRRIAGLTVMLALAIALPSVVRYLRHQQHVAAEQSRAALDAKISAWRDREFEKVKNGDPNAFVMDLKMLSMLANDEDCVDHVEFVHFDMVEITPHAASNISKLKHVKTVSFYDSRGADFVLNSSRDLPIETFSLHQAELSHDALRSLATFPKLNSVRFNQVIDSNQMEILESLPSRITICMGYPPRDETCPEDRDEQTDAPERE